jgi:hypothetical protein
VGVSPKAFVLSLILCFLVSAFSVSVAFASSSNWVEVVTFHNIVGFWATSRFNVFHDDWRIKWEIYPSNGSESPSLKVLVYHDMGHQGIENISSLTTHETTGILNIYNASGKFFLAFWATNTNSSSILIIEQNTDSIPEFPSWTIIPLVLTITLFSVIIKRNMKGV